MKILVTGYAGFIGSNLFRMLISRLNPGDEIYGLDCHTYAARPVWAWQALSDLDERFIEVQVDLRNTSHLEAAIAEINPDQVYHLAAESHVCRSIDGPRAFAETNYMGTFNLLEALRKIAFGGRMVHVSTDEAFGELGHNDEPFCELTPIQPNSPYSASKAASDLMVRAYVKTYGMNIMTTRCTNNFGPNQHEEKLIPKAIISFMKGNAMTIHGDGSHSRDWIFVDDHCRALITVMDKGLPGQLYCVGSGIEINNREVVSFVQDAMVKHLNWRGEFKTKFTNDRPTDDVRYAVKTHKIRGLGWDINRTQHYFLPHLEQTVRWYAEHLE